LLFTASTSRTYPYSYTITSPNTWEYKTITIPGDVFANTPATTNNLHLIVQWALGVGSTFTTATAGWQTGNFATPSGCVNVLGTSGATLQITGVQFEKAAAATSFEHIAIGTQLALCQRYYQNHGQMFQCGYAYGSGTDGFTSNYSFAVTMRAAPTSTVSSGNDGQSGSQLVVSNITAHKATFEVRATSGNDNIVWYTWVQEFTSEI
jgi:hypothetical protein